MLMMYTIIAHKLKNRLMFTGSVSIPLVNLISASNGALKILNRNPKNFSGIQVARFVSPQEVMKEHPNIFLLIQKWRN